MQDESIRGVPWTLLSYVGSKGVSVLSTLVLARLIAPADFGLLALATIATNFLTWVADLGFSGTVVQRQDFGRRELGTVLTLMAVTGIAAGLIAVAVAPLAALAFGNPRVIGVLAAIAALLPLGSIAGFWEALMARELQFRRRFFAVIAQPTVAAGVSIPLAAAGAGVWALVLGQIAGFVVLGALLVALAPYRVPLGLDRTVARDAFRTGRGFLGQGMAMYVRQNVDTVAVGVAFGSRPLGWYSMANRFGDLVYWVIAHPVAKVTFPSFARSAYEGADIRPQFLRVLGMVALVACPVGVLMSAAAAPFTTALFGPRWLPMIGPLTIMGLWAAVRQMDQTLGWLLNSVGRPGALGWLSVVILIPLIAGCAVAVQVGHLTAVALVPLGDTLLSAGLSAVLVRRFTGLSLGTQWRAVAPAVVASVPAWLATWGTGRLLGIHHQPLLVLIVAVVAGLLTYVAGVRLLAPDLVADGLTQLGRMLGRSPLSAPSGGRADAAPRQE